jgi:hypothetical protein
MYQFEIYAANSYRTTIWAPDAESAIIDFLNDNPNTMHRDRVTAVQLPRGFGE